MVLIDRREGRAKIRYLGILHAWNVFHVIQIPLMFSPGEVIPILPRELMFRLRYQLFQLHVRKAGNRQKNPIFSLRETHYRDPLMYFHGQIREQMYPKCNI